MAAMVMSPPSTNPVPSTTEGEVDVASILIPMGPPNNIRPSPKEATKHALPSPRIGDAQSIAGVYKHAEAGAAGADHVVSVEEILHYDQEPPTVSQRTGLPTPKVAAGREARPNQWW
jgi:hypothetical protein